MAIRRLTLRPYLVGRYRTSTSILQWPSILQLGLVLPTRRYLSNYRLARPEKMAQQLDPLPQVCLPLAI